MMGTRFLSVSGFNNPLLSPYLAAGHEQHGSAALFFPAFLAESPFP
jgi:hypothetical protein